MKHFIFLTFSLLLLAMATSCHSNEQNFHALGLKNLHWLERDAQVAAVGVAIDGSDHRGYGFEAVEHFLVAYVAGMPYLVAVGKILGITVVPI